MELRKFTVKDVRRADKVYSDYDADTALIAVLSGDSPEEVLDMDFAEAMDALRKSRGDFDAPDPEYDGVTGAAVVTFGDPETIEALSMTEIKVRRPVLRDKQGMPPDASDLGVQLILLERLTGLSSGQIDKIAAFDWSTLQTVMRQHLVPRRQDTPEEL